MTKITKTAARKPATPTKAPGKNPGKAAVAMPAAAEAKKPLKSVVAEQPMKSVAKKKPHVPVTHSHARAMPKPEVSAEQRRCYVEVAAYFIAVRHGFTPGRDAKDWATAEVEIERMIADGMLRTE